MVISFGKYFVTGLLVLFEGVNPLRPPHTTIGLCPEMVGRRPPHRNLPEGEVIEGKIELDSVLSWALIILPRPRGSICKRPNSKTTVVEHA